MTFVGGNNKLRGIARGAESRNSLNEILSYKLETEARKGRSISNQKLLFKNKTGLSDITMSKIKLEEFNDVVDLERVEDRVRFSRGWVHANSEALLGRQLRIGYSAESLQRERPSPVRLVDGVARSQLKELLRATLSDPRTEVVAEPVPGDTSSPEEERAEEARSTSDLPTVKGLKRVARSPPRLLKRIEDNDNYIVQKSVDKYTHWDKLRKGPRFSRSKEDMKRVGKGIVEAHIVNKPNNYSEARLRQALLGNKTLK